MRSLTHLGVGRKHPLSPVQDNICARWKREVEFESFRLAADILEHVQET